MRRRHEQSGQIIKRACIRFLRCLFCQALFSLLQARITAAAGRFLGETIYFGLGTCSPSHCRLLPMTHQTSLAKSLKVLPPPPPSTASTTSTNRFHLGRSQEQFRVSTSSGNVEPQLCRPHPAPAVPGFWFSCLLWYLHLSLSLGYSFWAHRTFALHRFLFEIFPFRIPSIAETPYPACN